MNDAMGAVTGELIQMNAKMVMGDTAVIMVVIGVLFGALAMIVAFMRWLELKKRWWAWLAAAVLLAGMAFWGNRLPRVRIIHACVNGPVSLERVAARYDIVRVDGKELVLRER